MSEMQMILEELNRLRERVAHLETRQEHPGYAASDVARLSVANTFAGVQTIPNTGLHVLDTNASHDLIIAPGSNLTADRTLTVTTGDADRTITLSGDPTLGNWFDQNVKTTAVPTFSSALLSAAEPYLNFYKNDGAADEKYWRYQVAGTYFSIDTVNDAFTAMTIYLPLA